MTASLPVEEIKKEFHRAEKSLQSARLLLRDNLLEDALSRAYYAILHAARAVLLAEVVSVTSHRAVRRLFGQHLIKSGKLSAHLATILAEEQDDRMLADYDVLFDPERERVQPALLMTVRREIAQSRRETCTRSRESPRRT